MKVKECLFDRPEFRLRLRAARVRSRVRASSHQILMSNRLVLLVAMYSISPASQGCLFLPCSTHDLRGCCARSTALSRCFSCLACLQSHFGQTPAIMDNRLPAGVSDRLPCILTATNAWDIPRLVDCIQRHHFIDASCLSGLSCLVCTPRSFFRISAPLARLLHTFQGVWNQ